MTADEARAKTGAPSAPTVPAKGRPQTGPPILAVAVCVAGQPEQGFQDALACARAIARLRPAAIVAVLVGAGGERAGRAVARTEGVDVLAIGGEGLTPYTCEAYRRALAAEIRAQAPVFVCTPNSSRGAEWAPAVAAELGAACITAVDGVEGEGETPCFLKELYGGKVRGRFAAGAGTTFVTVQSGAFSPPVQTARAPGSFRSKTIGVRPVHSAHLGTLAASAAAGDLAEARTVVAAGNGIGEADNLRLIEALAEIFPQSAVAGTRIVCDRGWLDYGRQVGVTGASVAPDLYIACGVSGAVQHRAGMCAARFVVAINSDPGAPIFNAADICIIEDLKSFIPLLLDLCWEGSKAPQPP